MKKTHLVVAFVAIALFVWVLAHLGFSTLVEQLKAIRSPFPIVVSLSLVRLLLQTTVCGAERSPSKHSLIRGLLLMVRHFAEICGSVPVLTFFLFSGFRMASRLHCFLASVIKTRKTTPSYDR